MLAAERLRGPQVPVGSAAEAERQARPIVWWAVLGAVFLAVQFYALSTWILSGNATPTPDGPTPIPGWMTVLARVLEVGSLSAWAACFYAFVIRPWRRQGRLSADGLFALVFCLIWWQDPMLNYFQTWFTYNTAFVNFGAWTQHMPGWLSPQGHKLAEPILFGPPAYLWVIFGGVVICGRFMRWVKARRPSTGVVGLIGASLAFFVLFDALVEGTFMRLGLYSYPGSPKPFTLFSGTYYQFPVHEKLSWAVTWAAWACLRYFRDDKGRTIVERGVDRLKLQGRRQTLARFLALSGACNLIWLVLYNAPMAAFGLYASPWPDSVLNRSYLTDTFCGPGAEYACPGPGLPVPRPDSKYFGPDGEVRTP